jgi:hypothetical protein
MNERIKQLAEQSMVLDYSTWDSYNQKTVEHYKFDKEKFAELLVKECIECVENTDKNMMFTSDVAGHVGAAHNRSIRQIKQHFGVSE